MNAATLLALRKAVVRDLAERFKTLDVDSHPTQCSVREARRMVPGVIDKPRTLIRVALLRADPTDSAGLTCMVGLDAAVLVFDCAGATQPTFRADERALLTVDALLRTLHRGGVAGDLAGRPEQISAENRFDVKDALEGAVLWGVTWQQRLDAVADDSADLDDFLTLSATWDFANDGKPEATDQVSIEGP